MPKAKNSKGPKPPKYIVPNPKVINLIRTYERYSVIWDKSDRYYHFKHKQRKKAWEEICKEVQMEEEKCKTKLRKCINGFRESFKKIKNKGDLVHSKNWPIYKELKFLYNSDEYKEVWEEANKTNSTNPQLEIGKGSTDNTKDAELTLNEVPTESTSDAQSAVTQSSTGSSSDTQSVLTKGSEDSTVNTQSPENKGSRDSISYTQLVPTEISTENTPEQLALNEDSNDSPRNTLLVLEIQPGSVIKPVRAVVSDKPPPKKAQKEKRKKSKPSHDVPKKASLGLQKPLLTENENKKTTTMDTEMIPGPSKKVNLKPYMKYFELKLCMYSEETRHEVQREIGKILEKADLKEFGWKPYEELQDSYKNEQQVDEPQSIINLIDEDNDSNDTECEQSITWYQKPVDTQPIETEMILLNDSKEKAEENIQRDDEYYNETDDFFEVTEKKYIERLNDDD